MYTRNSAPAVLAAAVVAALVAVAGPAQAAKPVKPPKPIPIPSHTTTVVGTDPFAAAQPTAAGHLIRDLGMDGGRLYVAYGDYDANTGPQQVHTFDPVSGQFSPSALQVPTEEISVYRKLNGKLYAPMTDPRDPWTSNVGYATNASGSWTNEMEAPAVHVFDVATMNGSDRWMVGSVVQYDPAVAGGGAAAYRSTDGADVAGRRHGHLRRRERLRALLLGGRHQRHDVPPGQWRHGGCAAAGLQRHHLVDGRREPAVRHHRGQQGRGVQEQDRLRRGHGLRSDVLRRRPHGDRRHRWPGRPCRPR